MSKLAPPCAWLLCPSWAVSEPIGTATAASARPVPRVSPQASLACDAGATATPGAPISVHTVNAVREARASAAGSRRIWLTPSVIPLAAAFGMLAALTYYQAGVLMAHNRQSHRPHGLLGPAVNEFVDEDEGDDSKAKAERDSRIRQSYRSRLHSQRGQAVPADAGKQASS